MEGQLAMGLGQGKSVLDREEEKSVLNGLLCIRSFPPPPTCTFYRI